MTDDTRAADLVVRYRPEAMDAARAMLVPAIRRRAGLALAVAVVTAVAIAVPTLLAGDGSGRVLLLATLTLPAALAVVAVRRLRRPPHLPTVAFTVTREHVVFEPQESTGLRPRITPAHRWDLATTTAKITAGDGPARLELTSTATDPARTRAFPVDRLDVPATTILQALRRR